MASYDRNLPAARKVCDRIDTGGWPAAALLGKYGRSRGPGGGITFDEQGNSDGRNPLGQATR